MSFYKEPEWAVKPASDHAWTLVEIKSGLEVAQHILSDRGTTLLGRAVDLVHIPIHHESASRQHARIAFDSQGIPWLKDLKSTHGTTVNKRKLPPPAIGTTESNSTESGARGIMLFPGDILQFGASTRLFSLEGPAEFDRGAMQAKIQQQRSLRAQERTAPQHTQTHGFEGRSRLGSSTASPSGSDDDAENVGDHDDHYDDDDKDYGDGSPRTTKILPMDVQVPEKHRKTLEKLNAMKYKLANLETEDGRIRRKGELTEGQEKQLQRNADREEALKKTILGLEESLYDKLYPSDKQGATARKQKGKSQGYSSNEEDDDYFDRTKAGNLSGVKEWIGSETESEMTLTAKWKALYLERDNELRTLLPDAKENVRAISLRLEKLQASGDEEAFFVKNDLLLAKEALKKIESSLKSKERAMDDAENLLQVVNAKIRCDRDSGYIGEGPQRSIPSAKDETADSIARQVDGAVSSAMAPPPAVGTRRVPENQQREAKELPSHVVLPPPPGVKPSLVANLETEFEHPPPKKKRIVGPNLRPPISTASITQVIAGSAPPSGGTLAFLTNHFEAARGNMTNKSANKGTPTSSQTTIDPKQDVWRAPTGQDGSGYTSLNKKFGGRY